MCLPSGEMAARPVVPVRVRAVTSTSFASATAGRGTPAFL
jgi:hypothetical protein